MMTLLLRPLQLSLKQIALYLLLAPLGCILLYLPFFLIFDVLGLGNRMSPILTMMGGGLIILIGYGYYLLFFYIPLFLVNSFLKRFKHLHVLAIASIGLLLAALFVWFFQKGNWLGMSMYISAFALPTTVFYAILCLRQDSKYRALRS